MADGLVGRLLDDDEGDMARERASSSRVQVAGGLQFW